jgi:hypothetical protein
MSKPVEKDSRKITMPEKMEGLEFRFCLPYSFVNSFHMSMWTDIHKIWSKVG